MSFTDEEFWDNYQMYLSKTCNKYTCKARLLYSKKYFQVLEEFNAEHLLTLSNDNRIHAMKALATLSKYLGCYDLWKDIVHSYQLKWSTADSVQAFQNISNAQKDLTSMIAWVKELHSQLPKSYGNILIYDTLTGLRPQEACESIRLLKNDFDNYIKRQEDSMTLEHFKYPQFISDVCDEDKGKGSSYHTSESEIDRHHFAWLSSKTPTPIDNNLTTTEKENGSREALQNMTKYGTPSHASHASHSSQGQNANQPLKPEETKYSSLVFSCYHCKNFQTYDEDEYVRHGNMRHPKKPMFPSKADLQKNRLNPQRKSWEI